MESIFRSVWGAVMENQTRILAMHKAVIDNVLMLPLTRLDYMDYLRLDEARYDGQWVSRLGGGGANFAMVAASMGAPGIHFAGFLGVAEESHFQRLEHERGLRIPRTFVRVGDQTNVVIELYDANIIFKERAVGEKDVNPPISQLMISIKGFRLGSADWLACCSAFNLKILEPLLEARARLFVDSGYNYSRRQERLASRLCALLREQPPTELIIAANERELENMADEFGNITGNLLDQTRQVADAWAKNTGRPMKMCLHSERFSTLVESGSLYESGSLSPWVVPAMEIEPVRRTNAGDTFAAILVAAYNETRDGPLSCAIANAVTAKRLTDNQLPTPGNTAEFLRTARLREIRLPGARTIGLDEMRETAAAFRQRRTAATSR